MGRGGGSRAAGAIAHVWRWARCSKRPGFVVREAEHGVHAETRTVCDSDSVVVAGSVTVAVAGSGSVSRSIAAGPADAAGSVDITDTRRVLVRTLG